MAVVSCPTCGKRYEVADQSLGGSVHCSDCARSFVAERPAAAVPRKDLMTRDADDDERRPRRRSERYEAHRGGLVMAMGIVSILVGGIGLVTGILAWVWGNEDLKKMDAGIMDPEGRSNTQLGKVLGMIGTILHSVGLVIGLCGFVIMPLIFGIAMFGAISAMPTAPMPATGKTSTVPSNIPPTKSAPTKFGKKKTTLFVPSRTADYLPPRCA